MKVARVAQNRREYEAWPVAPCSVCGLAMPVHPVRGYVVSHYPEHNEHRHFGHEGYYCAGSGDPAAELAKDPLAVALGRRGGLKGGRARAASMTPEQRSDSARRAAQVRWARKASR